MKINFLFYSFFILLSIYLFTQDIDKNNRKNEIEAEIKKIESEKSTILNEIYKLELIFEKELIKNKALELKLNNISHEISLLNEKKVILNKQISLTRDNLLQALRILYKTKKQSPFLFIIRIKTLSNLFRHYHYFNRLFNFKSIQLSDLKNKLYELVNIEKELDEKRTITYSLKNDLNLTLKQLKANKESRIKYLEKVNKEYRYFKQLYDEIAAQDTEISKVIKSQPYLKRIESVKTEKLKGRLPWPIHGKVLNQFGKVKSTQFNTFVFNNGIRIKPIKTDNICSVYQGVVLLATYFKGYGKLLIIRHSKDLYTLYGHCSSIRKSVGDWVEQNEIVATAGDTGSTLGKVLYFEIRKGIISENPLLWLTKKKR